MKPTKKPAKKRQAKKSTKKQQAKFVQIVVGVDGQGNGSIFALDASGEIWACESYRATELVEGKPGVTRVVVRERWVRITSERAP